MGKEFESYCHSLYRDIPEDVYVVLIVMFCIGSTILFAMKGFCKGWRQSACLLVIEYVFLLFCSTVIYRVSSMVISGHNFHPFWSYTAIQHGRIDLIAENMMNIVVFLPVGLLLGMAIKGIKWWQAILIGCCLSFIIEALQLIFKRGFAEVDDVIHNSLGCLIGFGLYKLVALLYKILPFLDKNKVINR